MSQEEEENDHLPDSAESEPTPGAAAAEERGGSSFTSLLWVMGFILFYFALQIWILPAAGIQT